MKDPVRLGFLVLGLLWIASCMPGGNFGLLNGIILYTHEGGHLICMPFMPRLITIAMGTGMQLLLPLAIAAQFYVRGEVYNASISSLWLAASLRQSSVYAQDAIDQEKPLLFSGMSAAEELQEYGETEHDWINMLEILHLPPGMAHAFSALQFLLAIAVWGAALYFGLRSLGYLEPRKRPAKPAGRRAR